MPATATKLTRMRPRVGRPPAALLDGDEECVPLSRDSLHDLASPVNQIGSLTDLIVRKQAGELDADTKALFGYLQDSAARLQNLLRGLRTYMQVLSAPCSRRRVEGNQLLEAALAMVQPGLAQRGAAVTRDELPQLFCNPAQITYVLAELIENAIKFRGVEAPAIHVGAAAEKRRCVLWVRDNGIGIDPRYATRIFAPFKRVQNDRYPGSGMGLAIARRVVERHGGRMWVESTPGHGATFFLDLPKMKHRSAPPREECAA
ncbi:MAG TPA: ATP-binding protein [Bryobacteraceae bacterium]|nr:ATP-binding protein [Bryobacteraceae bacterium]